MKDQVIAVDARFQVIDENEDYIVVNKSAPLIVHPANKRDAEPTLLGGLEELLAYDIANGAKLSIINRLDRETSGIVLIAKRKEVASEFGKAMAARQVYKEYKALVYGKPHWENITIDAPILRKGEVEESKIWLRQMVHAEGKSCSTEMQLLETFQLNSQEGSLLKIVPKTGRMHQIRVHCAHLGLPIVGDKIYGAREEYLQFIETGMTDEMLNRLIFPRHALHATMLQLEYKNELKTWHSEMPAELMKIASVDLQFS